MKWLKHHILERTVAADWHELRQDQFVAIANLLHHDGMDEVERRTRIAWVLLDMSWRTPRKLLAFFVALSAMERYQITLLADPFLKAEGFTCTPLATIPVGRRKLHACSTDMMSALADAGLDAFTWGQADGWFMRYQKSRKPDANGRPTHAGDMDCLRAMAATLYAEHGVSRTERLKDASVALSNRIPERYLVALYTQWAAHRRVLAKECEWMFRNVTQKKAQRRKGGWADVIRSASGGKFGDFNSTGMAPMRVFLREASDAIEEGVRRKEEIERLKIRKRA